MIAIAPPSQYGGIRRYIAAVTDAQEDDGASDALLRASSAGDRTALEELLVRHYALVRAFVRLRLDPATRQRESVSDLVQSICREVLGRADRFDYRGEAAFRAWLCEAALHKIRDRRDYHRAQRRDPAREMAAATDAGWSDLAAVYRTTIDPVGRLLRIEEMEQLERAFDDLPDDQREALTLRSLCGAGYAEIAARTGRSEDATRKLVSRARARLAERIVRPAGDE